MNTRYPAVAAAIAGAVMTESMGIYPFRSASLAAQFWLVILMLIAAAPYAAVAMRAQPSSLRPRAFARGISITTVAVGVLAPAVFMLMFLSIMSLWAEHPHGLERVGHAVGAIAIVPFGLLLNHVPPLHLSPAKLIAFVLANIWLAIAVRLSRQERDDLAVEAAKDWRRKRRIGVLCGVAMPFVLMLGRNIYFRL
jgi:hypothetical protein